MTPLRCSPPVGLRGAFSLLLLAGGGGWAPELLAQSAIPDPSPRVRVEVEMTEGTNLAAALSPAGEMWILALQGVLWSLPAAGGTATPLTPPEMDAQEPVWSPRGDLLAFYAFADDGFSVWTVRPDGSDLRALTSGPEDARYPSFSPDGAQVLYSSDAEGGYSIWSHDLASGTRTRRVDARDTGYTPPAGPYFSGVGNAVYPVLSPDAQTLAFVIDGPEDQLILADVAPLAAGRAEFREVYRTALLGAPGWSPTGDALFVVGIENETAHLARVELGAGGAVARVDRVVEGGDLFPFRPQLTAAGRLHYTADGGIRGVDLEGARVVRTAPSTPFSARVTLDRTPYPRRRWPLTEVAPRQALGVIDPVLSPDGSRVIFTALGDLWEAQISTGVTRQLTDDVHVDLSPSWSPDGSRIAFVSDRGGKADLWVMELSTRALERVTDAPRPANNPSWSPDGRQIAYLQDVGNSVFISAVVKVLDLGTGQELEISEPLFGPSTPAWSPDGTRVAVYHRLPGNSRFREGVNGLYLLPASGQGERSFVLPEGAPLGRRQANRPAWSAEGNWVYRVDGSLWMAPLASNGSLGPAVQIAGAGENPAWSADGRHLLYLDGASLKLWDRAEAATRVLEIQPAWRRAFPDLFLTIRAGHLFDGTGSGVQENVDIQVERGRITAVLPATGAPPAEGTGRIFIDASSGFVVPGLIESHTHQSTSQGVALGQLYLCLGITSVRETGDDPYHAVERREAEASGRRPGPRVFTAGPLNEGARISYGVSETVGTMAALENAARLSSELELDLFKSYVRQDYTLQKRAIELAHEAGIPVSSHELYPAVAHGIDYIEHFGATSRRGYSLKVSRLNRTYQDVIELINRSGVVVVPTLALTERGVRDMRPQGEMLLRILDGGGRIAAGTDSPFVPHATSLHRELEIYAEAGLSPARALVTATSAAADAIGVGDQLGRVAPGYLADLLVLDADPLQDISNTRAIRTVIKNGAPVDCPISD